MEDLPSERAAPKGAMMHYNGKLVPFEEGMRRMEQDQKRNEAQQAKALASFSNKLNRQKRAETAALMERERRKKNRVEQNRKERKKAERNEEEFVPFGERGHDEQRSRTDARKAKAAKYKEFADIESEWQKFDEQWVREQETKRLARHVGEKDAKNWYGFDGMIEKLQSEKKLKAQRKEKAIKYSLAENHFNRAMKKAAGDGKLSRKQRAAMKAEASSAAQQKYKGKLSTVADRKRRL